MCVPPTKGYNCCDDLVFGVQFNMFNMLKKTADIMA